MPVTISVQDASHSILCGICERPIAFIGEVKPDATKAGCTVCNNIDEVEEVARIAGEYVKDELQIGLNRALHSTAKSIKFATFSGKTKNDKSYRFIIDWKV
jgi:hypothetical protein